MGDELGDLWRRFHVLEDIAERLAATCADPQAVADWWEWKAQADD